MSKSGDLRKALEAWRRDVDSEPFNAGELERKAQEQAKRQKDGDE